MEKWVFFVTLKILVYSFTFAENCSPNQDKDRTISFDTTCATDCSQKPPRIPGDTLFFNCSIGIQKDVDQYRKVHKKQFLPESIIFDAPKIEVVELYWKPFPRHQSELSLKFNFTLPYGADIMELGTGNRRWIVPQAVLLRFEALPGKRVDKFYSKCPRERIFQFHNYRVDTYYDMKYPRELMFDCMVGLEGNVYNITLQTAEGRSASYVTTVPDRDENIWHPVIMTRFNASNMSLDVVVEKPPLKSKVHSYRINLVHNWHGAVDTTEIKVNQKSLAEFPNLKKGQYTVKVTPLCEGACKKSVNRTTESANIDAGEPDAEEYPHYLEETLEPMKVVAMVTGCIMGGTLLLSITYCIRRRPKCQENSHGNKPCGLLLHPFESGTMTGEYDLVLKLKRYIDEACDCTVTNCVDLHLENSDVGQSEIVDKTLKDCSFVLLLYTSNCFNANATNYITDSYSCVLKAAIDRRSSHNDIWIVPLRFPFNGNNDISTVISSLSRSIPSVNFMDDPDKVYCKIHGFDKKPPSKCLRNENLSQFKDMWAELKRTINQVRNNYDVGQIESEPLLPLSSTVESNNDRELPKVKQYFQEIAMLNAETDSQIGKHEIAHFQEEHKQFEGHSRSLKGFRPDAKKDETSKIKENKRNVNNGPKLESYKEHFLKPGHNIAQKHNQSNAQMCEAEVHNSGENRATSHLLESRQPNLHNYGRQYSSPEHSARQLKTCGKKDDIHNRKLGSEKHKLHLHNERDQIESRNKFAHAMNFNAEDSDLEDFRMDETEVDEEKDTHNSGRHDIQPLLHGNLHHHSHHCRNREFDHRNPAHCDITFQENFPNQLSDEQPYMHHHGNMHFGDQRPHFRPGITHQQRILHDHNSFHQYQPDVCIQRNHKHQGAFSAQHLSNIDQENFTDHPPPHHHQQFYHHHHLNDLQQHPAEHFNGPDQYLIPPVAHEQIRYNCAQDINLQSPSFNFDAFDPRNDLVKETEKNDQQTVTDLSKASSVHSLPTELENYKWIKPEDFGSYSPQPPTDSPEPPEDLDDATQSRIMDLMMQINENNT